MRYNKFEIALSPARLNRYVTACNGNKARALQLYRYNVKLCERLYGILNVFEVILRNAIDNHYKNQYCDPNRIKTQLAAGGFLEHAPQNTKAQLLISNLTVKGTYTNDRIVSGVSFGFWPYMFTRIPFRLGGQSLLRIFPNRTTGTNQRTIYNELQQIKNFRNRIAHYEPVCFDVTGNINTVYACDNYHLILKYVSFFGYNPQELFYGMNTNPESIISAIDTLGTKV